jgi:hypothetical protein
MPYLVLHKAEVCARVEEVSGNRMFEPMEMPLGLLVRYEKKSINFLGCCNWPVP